MPLMRGARGGTMAGGYDRIANPSLSRVRVAGPSRNTYSAACTQGIYLSFQSVPETPYLQHHSHNGRAMYDHKSMVAPVRGFLSYLPVPIELALNDLAYF